MSGGGISGRYPGQAFAEEQWIKKPAQSGAGAAAQSEPNKVAPPVVSNTWAAPALIGESAVRGDSFSGTSGQATGSPVAASSVAAVAPQAGAQSGIQWTGLDKLVQKLNSAGAAATVSEMNAFYSSNKALTETLGTDAFISSDAQARAKMLEGRDIIVNGKSQKLPAGIRGTGDLVNFHADETAKATGKPRVPDPEKAAGQPKYIDENWVRSAIEETLNALPSDATQADVEKSLSAALNSDSVTAALINNKGEDREATADHLKAIGKEFAAQWFATARPDAAAKADGDRAEQVIDGWKKQTQNLSEPQLDSALTALGYDPKAFGGVRGSTPLQEKRAELESHLDSVAPPGHSWDENDKPVKLNRPYDSAFAMRYEFYVVLGAMRTALEKVE